MALASGFLPAAMITFTKHALTTQFLYFKGKTWSNDGEQLSKVDAVEKFALASFKEAADLVVLILIKIAT